MNRKIIYVPISSGIAYNSLLNEILSEMPDGSVEREDVGGYVQIYVDDEPSVRFKLIDCLLENNFPVYGTDPHEEKEFINCLERDERTADKWSTVIMKDADRLITDILSVMSNENRQRPSVHTDDIYDMCCSIVDKTIDVIYLRLHGIEPRGCIAESLANHTICDWEFDNTESALLLNVLATAGASKETITELLATLLPVDQTEIDTDRLNVDELLRCFSDDESDEMFSNEPRTVYSEIVNEEISTYLTEKGENALSNMHTFVRKAFTNAGMTDNKNTEIRDSIDASLDELIWNYVP